MFGNPCLGTGIPEDLQATKKLFFCTCRRYRMIHPGQRKFNVLSNGSVVGAHAALCDMFTMLIHSFRHHFMLGQTFCKSRRVGSERLQERAGVWFKKQHTYILVFRTVLDFRHIVGISRNPRFRNVLNV